MEPPGPEVYYAGTCKGDTSYHLSFQAFYPKLFLIKKKNVLADTFIQSVLELPPALWTKVPLNYLGGLKLMLTTRKAQRLMQVEDVEVWTLS